MIILGIESSCDETAAAVLRNGTKVLSSVVSSQVSVHRDYGGVVPELASREHIDNICVVVDEALAQAGIGLQEIEGIGVTRGPGLVGALLVGLSYAKGLAYSLGVPFVGVNHLEGHLQSIFLDHPTAELPALALVVSGGHTNLYYYQSPAKIELVARTRDDAAGEALDKLAKLLGLGYPGGPVIDRLAPTGDPRAVRFAIPKISDGSLDFSFSGIKTAALRYVQKQEIPAASPEQATRPEQLPAALKDLVASYQHSIVKQLLHRVEQALKGRRVRSIQISGGVSCNSELRDRAAARFKQYGLPVYFPRPALTTDNAAMIAAAASRRLSAGERDGWDLTADPNLRDLTGLNSLTSPVLSQTRRR